MKSSHPSTRGGSLGAATGNFAGIVRIPIDHEGIEAEWTMPRQAHGVVLFAHGSGSSRHSRRNQFVASLLRQAGVGTVLLDLLTAKEERVDAVDASLRFDIELLTNRLITAIRWVEAHPAAHGHRLGLFGASTGAAAAVAAASILGAKIAAVVSRGGRPDLAYEHLIHVQAATLFIVGERDEAVLKLNTDAFQHLRCEKKLTVVPGASHLFEEPGTLERAAHFAAAWFEAHLAGVPAAAHMEVLK